jgi:hypothetical protein
MPGMHLAVVPVAGMSTMGSWSAIATVEEAATAAAEEADNGRCRRRLCSAFVLGPFFSLHHHHRTEGCGDGAVSRCEAHPGRVVLVAVVHVPSSALALLLLSLLSLCWITYH